MCPALTLQQVYKLTEHHHDDWITTGSQTTDTLVLLQTLKRIVDATVRTASACLEHAPVGLRRSALGVRAARRGLRGLLRHAAPGLESSQGKGAR